MSELSDDQAAVMSAILDQNAVPRKRRRCTSHDAEWTSDFWGPRCWRWVNDADLARTKCLFVEEYSIPADASERPSNAS